MSNKRPWLLLLTALSVMPAVESWTVPAISPPVRGEFTGFVEAERSKLVTLAGPGSQIILSSFVISGSAVGIGEPAMTFDTSLIERDLPKKIADVQEAEIRYSLDLLKLERTRADILDQQARGRADLAAVRARLAALGSDDLAEAALVRAQADLSQADAHAAARAALRIAARASAGDATAQELLDANHDAAQAALMAEKAATSAARMAQRDRSGDRGKLLLEEQQIMGDLGLVRNPDGTDSEDPHQGLAAQLRQNRESRAAQESGLAAERDARRKSLHELQRTLCDHTPLEWIELVPKSGGVPLRWDLTAGKPAAGWLAEDGSLFSTARGFGFAREVRDLMAGNGAKPEDTWCLISEPVWWRAVVPNGEYTVRVGIGADVDWDGSLVRTAQGEDLLTVYVQNRLDAGVHEIGSAPVTITNGELRVLIGSEPGKHLFSTVNGTFIASPRAVRGLRIDSRTRTLGFVAEPAAVRINARAPADIAPLLAPAMSSGDADAAAAATDLRRRIAIRQVTIIPPGQAPCRGDISEVLTKPAGVRVGSGGWNEENPGDAQDLTHREVYIQIDPAAALRLKMRSQVTLQFAQIPPAGITVVPPWLVTWRTSVAWIRTTKGWRQVSATRSGGQTLVAGLVAGEQLEIPTGEPPQQVVAPPERSEADGGFAGQVVPGQRVNVTLKGGWGKVATLVADGQEVEAGDELMTLVNPKIEQQMDDLTRQRREAARAFAQAATDRQSRLIEASAQRRQDELREGRARLDTIEAHRPDDHLAELKIAARLEAATDQHAAAALTATQNLTAPPVGELANRVAAAQRARLAAERAALDAAVSAHAKSWFDAAKADAAWEDAFSVLGQKEAKDLLARAEDSAATAKAAAVFERARQGQSWVIQFEQNKVIYAPAAGRLYWHLAWNDQTRALGAMAKDAWVWGGASIAEIVDLAHLSFTAELPEILYQRLALGQKLAVRFPVLGNRRIPGTVTEIGQALGAPRDLATAPKDEKITDLRVFTVTLSLTLAPTDHGQVQPGLRGILELP